MAVDLKAEMAKLVARRGEAVAELLGPDLLLGQIVRHGDMNDFREFFARYAKSGRKWKFFRIHEYDSLFGPRWMARFEPAHLKWIYHLLAANDHKLKYTAKLIADRRIAAERRALCFHAVFSAETHSKTPFGSVILPNFWWYNRGAWSEYLRHVRENSDDAFIKRLDVSIRQTPAYSDSTWAGIRNDSPATLEINRELDNRRISDSLLKCLIKHDAVKCFVHMLKHRADQVFKLRTPREWLLTVCRCAPDELAAAAVNELEHQFPGIVARTRDPWGNTPLWNTFFNAKPTDKLRSELIRLGCDPEAENEWGLSYRMLKENPLRT